MAIKYMYQHLPLQDAPKFTRKWNFWFESMPSGNPALKAKIAFSLLPPFLFNFLPFENIMTEKEKKRILVH
jgi:hypothetical protein